MEYFYKYLTPIIYILLIVIWAIIFVFYILKLRGPKVSDKLFKLLLLILAIDAFRSLFESVFFGASFSSLMGFFPIGIYNLLTKPEVVLVPKLFNLITAVLILFLIINKWLKSEIHQKNVIQRTIEDQVKTITGYNEKLEKTKEISEINEIFVDALLENIADGVIACDENGELVFFNKAAREWHETGELEGTKDEWTQKYNLYDSDSTTLLNKNEIPLVKAFNDELVQNQEIVIKTKGGVPRYVLASGSSFYNKNQDKLGAVIVMKDVTQIKSSESEAWSLFEDAAIQIWIEDFSEVKKYIELLKENNVSDFDAYFTKNPDELETIASLVKIINVNKKSLEFFGVKSKEVLVKNLNNFFMEASYPVFKEEIIALANGETTFTSEITIRDLNGEDAFLIISLTVSPMFVDTFSRVLVSFIDITSLKKADLELKKREERYRLLADNSKDLICLHEPDGSFIYLSPSIDFLVGYDQSELVGTNPYDIIHQSDIDRVKKEINNNLVQKKNFVSVTFRVKNRLGKHIWFETLINPIIKNGELIRIVSSSRDVTNNVEHNREIENYQHSLQSLTKEISLLEERQKKAIAANIHDHMSQSLVISKMKLSELEKVKGLNKHLDDIKFIKHHISEALENSRKITYELSPPVLYQLGIVDTMYWLSDKILEQYKIRVNFKSNKESIELDESRLIFIFRIIQEITTNTIKHAEASEISIDFEIVNKIFKIEVKDNGKGFNLNKSENKGILNSGFGLFTIKERVKNLKGDVSIESSRKEGTKILVTIPLDK